ncbi:Spc24 subunit of Ndc80-domain-containing protein [Bisporella sp. PMI_857]|nr:Spc24 subunit of Ndc80-domain-containing protein [Bisporella sp. PMI_857]
MLLDEDPATLIQHTIGNFNIAPDKQAVARINESLSTLQQARDLRVREAESALKKLSRTLTSLKNHHHETISTHSAAAHASEIATLDTQKFRVAKAASDLEIESERLSSQLVDLQARLQELEMQGVDGGDNARRTLVDDEISLKLKLIRGLGLDAEREGGSGDYNKVIIRQSTSGEPQILSLDNNFSKFFYANLLWKVM